MTELQKPPQTPEIKTLSVALVGADELWRTSVANMLSVRQGVQCHEVSQPGPDPTEFAISLASKYDVAVLDVDSGPEYVFRLAEALCAHPNLYVMACSTKQDMKLAIRYMRVGVREFFTLPVDSAEVTAALGRAADRQITVQAVTKPISKLFVFLGTKGGVGVTTLAANFALSISKLSDKEKRTIIIDLGLPLGDVAINLGMRTEYSVLNALIDPVRLDGNFLDSVVTKHSSGLAVLAAPVEFSDLQPPIEAFDKLINVACNNYDFIIVDAGSRVDLFATALFEKCTTIYLITQVGISELRNAHRMINHFFSGRSRSLQVVLNRYTQRALLFDDAQISKTISRDADWKIPDDYAAARRNREAATPVALVESTLAAAIRKMAREAAEIPVEKKKKGLFGF